MGRRRVRVHLCIDAAELPDEAAAATAALAAMRLDVDTDDAESASGADVFVGVYGDRYGADRPGAGVSTAGAGLPRGRDTAAAGVRAARARAAATRTWRCC